MIAVFASVRAGKDRSMKRLPRDQKEARGRPRLMRAYRAWHAEQLADAIAGAHGVIVAELMVQLDRLELSSAAALLDHMQRTDWSSVSYDVRLTVLHQINRSIVACASATVCRRSTIHSRDNQTTSSGASKI